MSFEVIITRNFEKEAKPLAKKYPSFKQDIAKLIKNLKINPEEGKSLGNNLYKVRVAIDSKNRGKSGGARIITYLVIEKEKLFLISIYDKAEYETSDTSLLLKILKDEGLR
ncbi:addiction module toxin RelE [Mucilaginibacter sp. L3T2-6]|uniref:type II toxin-antitoxin system RelE/ParE family toxin n=1 Tax=Mucilaginibacter sp. L3T2-6 TaxID=3062491 RepID=UPI00267554FD|nr:addiction module toxin RelE [Mucilaginibacter sp. L3T2-6]MDO3644824.1 addiction module toxin RelE [Mucilaginibacter sp. L3T2-6]MDV6217282.1 addiction module toxin RelE [Mucilaginibacter sp. L3T2-6]